MNTYPTTIKYYGGPRSNYELVYCEDTRNWRIRCTDRTAPYAQCYSAESYDSPRDAARAFDTTQITYVEAPGVA